MPQLLDRSCTDLMKEAIFLLIPWPCSKSAARLNVGYSRSDSIIHLLLLGLCFTSEYGSEQSRICASLVGIITTCTVVCGL